jgi:peptidoglycan/LPS O-acetylase OafA/YrhL
VKSSNIGYIPEIDHLRMLAAALVFGFHSFHYLRGVWEPRPDLWFLGPIIEGHTGVSLFFVLSGFIFMLIAQQSGVLDYRKFLRNRVLRIAPLFLVVFIVAISIGRDRFEATHLLAILVTNLGDAPTSWHFATGPAWSISVEFTFYLVFPFLAGFALRSGKRYLLGLVLMMGFIKCGAYLATPNSTHMLYSTLVGRFDQFLIGMLAAMVLVERRTVIERHAGPILLGAVVATFLALCAQAGWASFQSVAPRQPVWVVWGTLEAVLWASVIVGYVAWQPRWPLGIGQGLAKAGSWSFSFYMWHAMVIFIVSEALVPFVGRGGPAATGLAVLAFGLTFGVAWLSYVTIERPFLTLRTRYAAAAPAVSRAESG